MFLCAEGFETPIRHHFGVQKILVDRSEFVFQNAVEVLDDGRITFHLDSPKTISQGGLVA
jgi:hypothetical protein